LPQLTQGSFKEEIIPVEVAKGKEKFVFDTDEHPRRGLTMEKLAKLRPAFKEGGSVTAANSSGINDGAVAVLMTSESAAKELGLKPLMELEAWAVAGYDDILMGYTPYFPTKKLMEKTGLGIKDFDLVELNEVFASQSVAVMRYLGLDPAKVNVNGGAIALGHPVYRLYAPGKDDVRNEAGRCQNRPYRYVHRGRAGNIGPVQESSAAGGGSALTEGKPSVFSSFLITRMFSSMCSSISVSHSALLPVFRASIILR
jgi:hypothetical protein